MLRTIIVLGYCFALKGYFIIASSINYYLTGHILVSCKICLPRPTPPQKAKGPMPLTCGSLWHNKYCSLRLQWKGLHPNIHCKPHNGNSQDGTTSQGLVKSERKKESSDAFFPIHPPMNGRWVRGLGSNDYKCVIQECVSGTAIFDLLPLQIRWAGWHTKIPLAVSHTPWFFCTHSDR